MIAMKREKHHPTMLGCFTEPPLLTSDVTAAESMVNQLKTKTGHAYYMPGESRP